MKFFVKKFATRLSSEVKKSDSYQNDVLIIQPSAIWNLLSIYKLKSWLQLI